VPAIASRRAATAPTAPSLYRYTAQWANHRKDFVNTSAPPYDPAVPSKARDSVPVPQSTRKGQMNPKAHPRRATRTMYVAFISDRGGYIRFDLRVKNHPATFYIAIPTTHPVIQAFADQDGNLDKLGALGGEKALFHFDNFTTNEYLELATITRIEKLPHGFPQPQLKKPRLAKLKAERQ